MLYSVLVSRPHKFNFQASVATRTNHSPSRTLARSHLGGIRPVAPLSLGSCYLCFNLTAKSTCPPGLPSHRLLVLWLNFACAARLLQPPIPFSTDRARSSFLHLPSRFDSGELATRLLRHSQPARPSTYITLPYLFFFFYSYLKSPRPCCSENCFQVSYLPTTSFCPSTSFCRPAASHLPSETCPLPPAFLERRRPVCHSASRSQTPTPRPRHLAPTCPGDRSAVDLTWKAGHGGVPQLKTTSTRVWVTSPSPCRSYYTWRVCESLPVRSLPHIILRYQAPVYFWAAPPGRLLADTGQALALMKGGEGMEPRRLQIRPICLRGNCPVDC